MEQPAMRFHEMMMRAFLDRADIQLDEVTPLQEVLIHQPLRNGGVGIPHMPDSRKLAWLGSFAAAAETILLEPRFSTRVCGSALVQESVAAAVQQARQQQRSLGELDAASVALAPEFPTVESALELYGKPPPVDPDFPPAENQPPTAQQLQKFLTYDLRPAYPSAAAYGGDPLRRPSGDAVELQQTACVGVAVGSSRRAADHTH